MIDINVVKENVNILSKELSRLNIDSIFIEQDGKLDKIVYKDEQLHELRSCSKVLVAMAIGIAIEDKMLVNGIPLSLDTKIFPSIKKLVKIKNKNNLLKIQKWTIKNLLIHTTGYESQMMSERYIEDIDKNGLLDYALNYDIPFNVGTRFAYNNLEPFVLSVFFQESFGINLKDYINEKIFKRLNIEEFKKRYVAEHQQFADYEMKHEFHYHLRNDRPFEESVERVCKWIQIELDKENEKDET